MKRSETSRLAAVLMLVLFSLALAFPNTDTFAHRNQPVNYEQNAYHPYKHDHQFATTFRFHPKWPGSLAVKAPNAGNVPPVDPIIPGTAGALFIPLIGKRLKKLLLRPVKYTSRFVDHFSA